MNSSCPSADARNGAHVPPHTPFRTSMRGRLFMNITSRSNRSAAGALLLALGFTSANITPVSAADEEVAELQRVQVTGSRITRLDVEGPQPVVTITAEELRGTGHGSLADVLREDRQSVV